MGLRAIKRQVARARLKVMGLDRINKRMSYMAHDGLKNWEKAIAGESGEAAHKKQLLEGAKIKRQDEARKLIQKRKIRKVTV